MNKKRSRAVFGSALGISLIPLISQAQTTTNNLDSIETISIVGSRSQVAQSNIAAASYVLDEAHIRASGHVYLSDLIRSLPSVSLAQSGSTGGLTELRLRGAEANHVLVMIDGIVVND